jgi:hypothetical protein
MNKLKEILKIIRNAIGIGLILLAFASIMFLLDKLL